MPATSCMLVRQVAHLHVTTLVVPLYNSAASSPRTFVLPVQLRFPQGPDAAAGVAHGIVSGGWLLRDSCGRECRGMSDPQHVCKRSAPHLC